VADTSTDKTGIIIPSLDFFASLDEVLSSSDITLFDTNIAIPVIKSGRGENGRSRSIHDSLFQKGVTRKDSRKITLELKKYQRSYFSRLNLVLSKHPNLVTIEEVVQELTDYRYNALRISRAKDSPEDSKMGPNAITIWGYIRTLEKQMANGIDSFLFTLKSKPNQQVTVLKGGVLGSKEIYRSLFDIVYDHTVSNKIPMNSLCTDQYLVSNAFYLSCISGQRINIISRDSHLVHIMTKSSYDLRKRIDHEKKTMPSIQDPSVYLIKLRYKSPGLVLDVYKNKQ